MDDQTVIFHDPYLAAEGQALRSLANDIWQRIEDARPVFTRKPRKDAALRRKRLIENICANLLLILNSTRAESAIRLAIPTGKTKPTRYDRSDFPQHLVADTLVEMERAGVLIRHTYVFKQRHTAITPSATFGASVSRHGASITDVKMEPGGETIWLGARSGSKRSGHNKPPKHLVHYEDTPETIRYRSEMESINISLNRHEIAIAGEPQATVRLVRWFLLRSVDDAPAFNLMGRLSGRSSWMNLPSSQRHLMTIDGQPLADLDWQAMFAHLAYLHAGLPLPQSDPYDIPGLHNHRAAAKLGLLSLLSRSNEMTRLSPELKASLLTGWNAPRLVQSIAAHHHGIKHMFGTDIGVTLMKTESDILISLLLDLAEKDIPALPMHDGVLVQKRHKAIVVKAMDQASLSCVGVKLPVKEKLIIRT